MLIGAVLATTLAGAGIARSRLQAPSVRAVDENTLREYAGVYRWGPDAFLYLQLWHEFSGFDKPGQLVAFDESGVIRVLYPTGDDRFFAGPGVAVPSSVESRIEFQRDDAGRIISLTWLSDGAAARTARRAEVEKREDVRFSNGDVQLAGTLLAPSTAGKTPRGHSGPRLGHRRTGSSSCRSPDSWSAAAWRCSATTSAASAGPPATGRPPRSKCSPATWWRRSTT